MVKEILQYFGPVDLLLILSKLYLDCFRIAGPQRCVPLCPVNMVVFFSQMAIHSVVIQPVLILNAEIVELCQHASRGFFWKPVSCFLQKSPAGRVYYVKFYPVLHGLREISQVPVFQETIFLQCFQANQEGIAGEC